MNYPFRRIIIDIKNYFFLRKTIKKNIKTVEWEKYKLRVDWIGRIYTVINLPPEVLYSPDAPAEIRPAYILEESKPMNEYLTRLNLHEIIIPELKPISNSISWLILYKPYFQRLSLKWVIYRLFVILILIWSQHKFGALTWVFDLLKKAYGFIF